VDREEVRRRVREQAARARRPEQGNGRAGEDWPEGRRGDAWEPPPAPTGNGAAATSGKPPPEPFPEVIPASKLQKRELEAGWLWRGYLNPGGITLLSALWKAGKTTMLAHCLKSLESGGEFCGLPTTPAQVLYVTEESESRWAERRDQLRLTDHVHFLIRPFRTRPQFVRWADFIDHLGELHRERPVDLIVLDTLANLWPVRDENDAAAVGAALTPLHGLVEKGPGLLLVHHSRKSGGQEATSPRGSGALPAFVDTIVELTRFDPSNRNDSRRLLTGWGRWDETPGELVVQLTEDGYVAAGGDRHQCALDALDRALTEMLPNEPPGWTTEEIMDSWPGETQPRRNNLFEALRVAVGAGRLRREGGGRRGDPFRYWAPAPAP
jgi:hypothetical protein